VRAEAAHAIADVLGKGRSLDDALSRRATRLPADRDRALTAELAYGVLRHLTRLQAIADDLLHRPMDDKHLDVRCLMLVGLYQLSELRVPAHAAVAETVEAACEGRKPWASGLVNAVLRNYLREREHCDALTEVEPAVFAHPGWLLQALRAHWPADWREIVSANNRRPPMWLRVNPRRRSVDEYLRALHESGHEARRSRFAEQALALSEAAPVSTLPGFAEGEVSIQDAAAQLAAGLLEVRPGDRVLDACAAPGGKTTHLLELAADGVQLVALDQDEQRARRIDDNLQRLALRAQVVVADAARPADWWDGKPFQRVLLDAPCSATGVIRRHPDIKWLRRAKDPRVLAGRQAALLRALWPLLAPGGRLLYATCSVLPGENASLVHKFLDEQADAREQPIAASWGRECLRGRQILPGEDDMDGFYYACLEKH
jgi:16S rRNA (cytosine967-C5)-methyltransferase